MAEDLVNSHLSKFSWIFFFDILDRLFSSMLRKYSLPILQPSSGGTFSQIILLYRGKEKIHSEIELIIYQLKWYSPTSIICLALLVLRPKLVLLLIDVLLELSLCFCYLVLQKHIFILLPDWQRVDSKCLIIFVSSSWFFHKTGTCQFNSKGLHLALLFSSGSMFTFNLGSLESRNSQFGAIWPMVSTAWCLVSVSLGSGVKIFCHYIFFKRPHIFCVSSVGIFFHCKQTK